MSDVQTLVCCECNNTAGNLELLPTRKTRRVARLLPLRVKLTPTLTQSAHPLMPLVATDCTNHFWNSKKTMSIGMVIIEEKAKMSPHTLGS